MAAAGLVPRAIVLAFGALGGADGLRLLLQFAGRSPAVDLAVCVVAISLVTAPVLGTMLLARFVRKEGPGGGGSAPATDLFAQVTATVSVGAAFLVTACLLLAVPGGGLGAARLPIDFAAKNPLTVLAICAAIAFAVAAGSLPCAVHLRARFFFRGAGIAGGVAPVAPATATTVKVAAVLAAVSSLVASFVASGGFDDARAQLLHFPEFHWPRRIVTMPVAGGVAIVTVAGTMLLVRCSRRARNTAGAVGAAAARTSWLTSVPPPSSPSPVSLSLSPVRGSNSN